MASIKTEQKTGVKFSKDARPVKTQICQHTMKINQAFRDSLRSTDTLCDQQSAESDCRNMQADLSFHLTQMSE